MGWWATGHNDEIIGDGPADKMMDAFSHIVSMHRHRGTPVLTVKELLDAIAAALRLDPGAILEEKSPSGLEYIIAETESGERISSSLHPQSDETLVRTLCYVFGAISVEYESTSMNRKPRINELLATIDFVLGVRTESYAAITEEIPIKRIMAMFANE